MLDERITGEGQHPIEQPILKQSAFTYGRLMTYNYIAGYGVQSSCISSTRAIICAREQTSSFKNKRLRYVATVYWLMSSTSAIPLLGKPLAIKRTISCSRG